MNGSGFGDFVSNVGEAALGVSTRVIGNQMYKESLEKFMEEFSKNTEDFDVTLTITIQRRRIDGTLNMGNGNRNMFDEETFTINMKKGQKIDKVSYMGFERINVDVAFIKPGSGLKIVSVNRFMAETLVTNGTDITQNKQWKLIKPNAMSIECIDVPIDGKFNVKDPVYLDSRVYSSIFAIIVVIVLISVLIYLGVTGQLKFNNSANSSSESSSSTVAST